MKLVSFFVLVLILHDLEASPLFEGNADEPLLVSIETDLNKLRNEKADYHTSTDNHIDGRFQFRGEAYSIRLQTRGHNRFSKCTFPPLRVRFKKSEVKNGLLKDNHNLKLVTHCEIDQLELLYREYVVYKLYNLITPYSFQTRMLKIRYVDSNGQYEPIDSYAFFIESTNSIEKRLSLDELESEQDFNMKTYLNISKDWLNESQTRLQDAFQHFIRNNDWVIFHADPPGTLSAANIKYFHNENVGFPFPYDFDLAGVVTWDTESYQHRYGTENLCEITEMKRALTEIWKLKEDFFQLLDQESRLSATYRRDFADYLNDLEATGTFCTESS